MFCQQYETKENSILIGQALQSTQYVCSFFRGFWMYSQVSPLNPAILYLMFNLQFWQPSGHNFYIIEIVESFSVDW